MKKRYIFEADMPGWEPGKCFHCVMPCEDRPLDISRCPLAGAKEVDATPYIPTGQKAEGKTQKARLATVLSDYRPHSTFELVRKVYGVNVATVARLASRVDDLRREGWVIRAMKSKKQPNKWWYCAIPKDAYQDIFNSADKLCDDAMEVADAAAGEYE